MSVVRAVRLVGLAEAVSFLVLLLAAMPLKYLAGNPLGVRIVGPIHGALFVAYCVLVLVAAKRAGWDLGRVVTLIAAAFLPFGPFFTDRSLRADAPETAPDAAS